MPGTDAAYSLSLPSPCRYRGDGQRGIDLASLDVSYFTSLSYYILLLFGLRGAFALVFR